MRLAVIGVGHVGLVSAACLARWGHEVVGMDDDTSKIETLNAGALPFHEPGLAELIAEGREAGRLSFTTDLRDALEGATAAFVCVGTPALPGGAPNLTYVERVGREAATQVTHPLVLIEKSTVPANTGVRLQQVIAREQARAGHEVLVEVASNPEFLREGTAVEDTLHPDRIVIGAGTPNAARVVRAIYEPLLSAEDVPVIETDLPTAELIKHASNAFLATKISFINAVARVCEEVGADVRVVAQGMGHDARIGAAFLNAGIGYGGSCFPKDVDAFIHLSRSVGQDFRLLEEVRAINEGQLDHVMALLRADLWHLEGKSVALLGAAFKPGTDDLRNAPAMGLARRLLQAGATVRVFDPVATGKVKEGLPEVEVFEDALAACTGAHAAVVCTEWDEVAALRPGDLVAALAYPVLVDGRNVFEPEAMVAAGLSYHAIGRPTSRERP